MKASDVMTQKVLTIPAAAPIEEAARLMLEHRVSGLPVVDAQGAVVGMLTEGDLIRRTEIHTDLARSGWLARLVAPGRLAGEYVHTHAQRVEEVMTPSVVSVAADAPLAQVVALMESRRIRRIPVIDAGRLVGIVSRADLMRALLELLPRAHAAGAQAVIADAEIRRRILAGLDAQSWAPRACIEVTVENGIAELSGVFTDQREREAVRVLCENTPGVKGVRDDLLWIEPSTGMLVDAPAR